MWRFNTNSQNWTALKVFVGALSTATCYTTMERSRLAAIYAKFASSTVFYATSTCFRASDAAYIVSATEKLLTRKAGTTD